MALAADRLAPTVDHHGGRRGPRPMAQEQTVTALRVVRRSEWGARYGRGSDVTRNEPMREVVIHTEAGAVRDQDWPEITAAAQVMSLTEQQHIQAIERYHAVTLGWGGIGYSFLIARDGTIFEGRGWGRSGAHTEGRNSIAVGLCFLGHGDLQPATEAQWTSARRLIAGGIRGRHLVATPAISGHRNYSTKGKTCPGNLIYPYLHRLRGITGHTPTPITKDWLAMASEADVRRIVREEVDRGVRETHQSIANLDSKEARRYWSLRAWVLATIEVALPGKAAAIRKRADAHVAAAEAVQGPHR